LGQPNYEKNLSVRQIINFNSVLNKLDNEKVTLSKEETLCIANLFSEKIKKFGKHYSADLLSWTKISPDKLILMEEKDEYLEILCKVNPEYIENAFHYNLNFRSRNVIEIISKLKKSDTILLSRNPEPYKIGFVFELRESITFSFESQIDLTVVSFTPYNRNIENMFSEIHTRKEMYEILLTCNKKKYPKDNIDFFIEVLK